MADQTNIYNDFSNFMKLFNKNNFIEKTLNEAKENIKTEIKSIEQQENTIKKTQKSKCEICKVKINPVDAIISSCKCEGKYCLKHRMPETHNCTKITEIAEEQKKDLKKNLVKVTGCKLSTI